MNQNHDEQEGFCYDTLLMEYASGVLDEGCALLVASHITISPRAKRYVSQYESLGGALMNDCCNPVSMAEESLDAVLNRLEECLEIQPCNKADPPPGFSAPLSLPAPICQYMSIHPFQWQKTCKEIHIFNIPVSCPRSKVFLLKLLPGTKGFGRTGYHPRIILILEGRFHYETHTYERGDLFMPDEYGNEQPVADNEEGCLCLIAGGPAVTDPVTVMTGWIDQIFDSFFRR